MARSRVELFERIRRDRRVEKLSIRELAECSSRGAGCARHGSAIGAGQHAGYEAIAHIPARLVRWEGEGGI
jgi:hypothetical protein